VRGFRRPFLTLWALVLILALLAGCTRSGGGGGAGSDGEFQKVEIQPGERVKVTFWHAMGGVAGEAVDRLVQRFNSSQDRVEVEAVYQGSYDDALQKLRAAGPEGPTIMQVYEIGSRFMMTRA
jgi:hypothetical protein